MNRRHFLNLAPLLFLPKLADKYRWTRLGSGLHAPTGYSFKAGPCLVYTTAQSGHWHDASTWVGGIVPSMEFREGGQIVQISSGHRLTLGPGEALVMHSEPTGTVHHMDHRGIWSERRQHLGLFGSHSLSQVIDFPTPPS